MERLMRHGWGPAVVDGSAGALGSSARRVELGSFLRARRNGLDPSGRGLVLAARRRAPGLLREEVAALAGVSTTWYTYLEQGRDISPSPSVIDRVMGVLELEVEQRNYVRHMLFGTQRDAPIDAAATIEQVIGTIGGGPTPLYAANRNADLLGSNAAFERWYGASAVSGPPGRRNLLRWMVTSTDARDRLPYWETEVRDVIARLRGEVPTGEAVARRTELVAELAVASEVFRTWWDEHQVIGHPARYRHLRHPQLGVQVFRIIPLAPLGDTGFGFVVHHRVGSGILEAPIDVEV